MVETEFKRYNSAFKTYEVGLSILLFMIEKDAEGKIEGERFAHRSELEIRVIDKRSSRQ